MVSSGHIYSVNAMNFVEAKRKLDEIEGLRDSLLGMKQLFIAQQKISTKYHFVTPAFLNFGGIRKAAF